MAPGAKDDKERGEVDTELDQQRLALANLLFEAAQSTGSSVAS